MNSTDPRLHGVTVRLLPIELKGQGFRAICKVSQP